MVQLADIHACRNISDDADRFSWGGVGLGNTQILKIIIY